MREAARSLTTQFENLDMDEMSPADRMLMDQCTPTKIIIPLKDGRIDF